MSHIVTCRYCKQKFDRDTEPFVILSAKRYAHAQCANEAEENKNKVLKVLDPHNTVICKYCNKELNIKDAIKITNGCYAHPECITELTDSEKLDYYIMQLYEMDYVPPGIKKQINQYVKDYRFTYSGILKSLKYFFDIKKQPFNKNVKNIAIVPYVYQKAYEYYYMVWLASQVNNKNIIKKPEIVEICIDRPKKQKKKDKLFSFLEEDEDGI